MNQQNKILKALKQSKKGLSKLELFQKTGVWNIGARILELRKYYNIETIMVEKKGKRYGVYKLS